MSDIVLALFGSFGENIKLFFMTLLLALPLGLVISFGSMSKFTPLRLLTKTVVWILRGTPLMLQLMVVLYAPGLLLGIPMSNREMAAIFAKTFIIIREISYTSETRSFSHFYGNNYLLL